MKKTPETEEQLVNRLLRSKFSQEVHSGLTKLFNLSMAEKSLEAYVSTLVSLVPHQDALTKMSVYYLLKELSCHPAYRHQLMMTIAALHKEVLNQKPLYRACSYRLLATLELPELNALLANSLKKISSDQSAFVRRVALISLQSVYGGRTVQENLDDPQLSRILENGRKDVPLCQGLSILLSCRLTNSLTPLHQTFQTLCR